MPKAVFFSEIQEKKKCNHGASCKDQLKKKLAQANINYLSWQQEALGPDPWGSSVRKANDKFKVERHEPTKMQQA